MFNFGFVIQLIERFNFGHKDLEWALNSVLNRHATRNAYRCDDMLLFDHPELLIINYVKNGGLLNPIQDNKKIILGDNKASIDLLIQEIIALTCPMNRHVTKIKYDMLNEQGEKFL